MFQALINMQSIDVASEMVEYYSRFPPIMNGKKLIVQFSTHQELVTEQENQACQRAIRAAAEQTQILLNDADSFNHRTARILIENCISNITLPILFKVSLLLILSLYCICFSQIISFTGF